MFVVYVLFSDQAGKHYTGYTSNLEERIRSHNEYGSDWTSRHRPWRLIYVRSFEVKQEALVYERWLKSGVGRTFIQSLAH